MKNAPLGGMLSGIRDAPSTSFPAKRNSAAQGNKLKNEK